MPAKMSGAELSYILLISSCARPSHAKLCYMSDSIVSVISISAEFEPAHSETIKTKMSASNQQGKQSPERQVVDETGTAWRVTEMRVWDASGRAANSLVAAHARGFRRLWSFPDNWAELADLQLAELISHPGRKTSRAAASE